MAPFRFPRLNISEFKAPREKAPNGVPHSHKMNEIESDDAQQQFNKLQHLFSVLFIFNYYPLPLKLFDTPMNRVIPISAASTRNVGQSALYLLLTFAAIKVTHSLYRYIRYLTMSSSSSSSSATDAETLRRKRILSSKLYFDIPPSKAPMIYSRAYDISFLGIEKMHPFDSSKWGRICQFLSSDGFLDKNCIVEPLEASKEDLLVVHSESYLNSLKSSANVAMIIEVPLVALFPNCLVQKSVLYPFRKQVGGTILAAKLAKERGWAINVGGGFHHCSANRGGGFCAYADISLCIHYAFVQLNISRVMIIDLDAHQGNGHETDFSNDGRVYILDMYNPGIYPFDYGARRYIDQKVEVVSGTTTNEYLKKLDDALEMVNKRMEERVESLEKEMVERFKGVDEELKEIKLGMKAIMDMFTRFCSKKKQKID